jgi:hypothetical protein
MHPGSPHYSYHPDSIGWLRRRAKAGKLILQEDVLRLLKAAPRNFSDPLLQPYVISALEGGLRPPRGRKPRGPEFDWRLMVADELIYERAAEIAAARKRAGRHSHRGEVEPSVDAADEIGPELRLPAGRSLLNAISSLKSRHKEMKAAAATA